ncbi:protein CEBPZOS [Linepithema humile]|uniref:protein CEBPZOS n=1 Tax=Linepithema humile TaxID=83485 RepID=UPI00351EDA18
MLTKRPKFNLLQKLKSSAKAILILEGVFLLGSYGIWHRMNTSQDFRYYVHQHFPSLLESYYSIGEKLSDNNQLRTFDYTTWTQRNEN